VLVAADVAASAGVSVGAMTAASVIGGWDGGVTVGVGGLDEAQPARARQATIMVILASLYALFVFML